MTSLLQISL
jgi:hypothetical protein